MSVRGRRPTADVIKLATGNRGHRPLLDNAPKVSGRPVKPEGLRADESVLWDDVIVRCEWLTWADASKARVWCYLQAKFNRDADSFNPPMLTQLRLLGSDIGLDPGSRARLAMPETSDNSESRDKASQYF